MGSYRHDQSSKRSVDKSTERQRSDATARPQRILCPMSSKTKDELRFKRRREFEGSFSSPFSLPFSLIVHSFLLQKPNGDVYDRLAYGKRANVSKPIHNDQPLSEKPEPEELRKPGCTTGKLTTPRSAM